MDFSSIEAATYGDVENDEELMAELLALEADEKAKAARAQASARTTVVSTQRSAPGARRPPPGGVQLTPQILSEVIKDIPEDDILSGDDEEIDDPELLDELSNLVDEKDESSKVQCSQQPTAALDTQMMQRLQQLNNDYVGAIRMANTEGNMAKTKRYQRAADKIQELLKKVQAGKQIDESEIPVAIPSSAASPSLVKVQPPPVPERPAAGTAHNSQSDLPPSANPPPVPPHRAPTDSNVLASKDEGPAKCADKSFAPTAAPQTASRKLNVEQIKALLQSRRQAYVQNAQLANSAGDKTAAYEYYTVAKQFDEAIAAVNNGEVTECDENELPPAPVPYQPKKKETIPSPPKTLLEGLQQRMEKYKSICDQCKKENNDRKYRRIVDEKWVRMNSRIVKQYEEAIRTVRANRSIDISELPCPPGYPPLPSAGSTKPDPSPHSSGEISFIAVLSIYFYTNNAVASTVASAARMRQANEIGPLAPAAPPSAGQLPQSRQSQQLDFLIKRQLMFKQAALAARKKGDLETAKKYLLSAKGFDQMILASRSGLPVNIKQAPIPPQVQTSSAALRPALGAQKSLDVDQFIEGSPEDIFAAMERDLIRQVKLCEENRLAFTKYLPNSFISARR
ncbi:unnamed protein product [Toxocara canis]|uniref:Coiled-coil and C2 domain-containing protein 1-like n=1 Tax=Toxocara canis TaxID=6265 RepID=A0A183UZP6_TOXCA|nr:unnamed protein product [Toxocara canis]